MTEALRLSIFSDIGIDISSSQFFSTKRLNPFCSDPITNPILPFKLALEYTFVVDTEVPIIFTPFICNHSIVLVRFMTTTNGISSAPPKETFLTVDVR